MGGVVISQHEEWAWFLLAFTTTAGPWKSDILHIQDVLTEVISCIENIKHLPSRSWALALCNRRVAAWWLVSREVVHNATHATKVAILCSDVWQKLPVCHLYHYPWGTWPHMHEHTWIIICRNCVKLSCVKSMVSPRLKPPFCPCCVNVQKGWNFLPLSAIWNAPCTVEQLRTISHPRLYQTSIEYSDKRRGVAMLPKCWATPQCQALVRYCFQMYSRS